MPCLAAASVVLCTAAALIWPAFGDEYHDIAEQMASFRSDAAAMARLRQEAFHPASLIEDADRDPLDVVLRRTGVLLDTISGMANAPSLETERREWTLLKEQCEAVPAESPVRRELFIKACALRRGIAFSNPLIDFDRILFLKHDRAKFEHMVDQYYGFQARPAGGVFVLENAFSDRPVVRDVLADARVGGGGRLDGHSLQGGSFISLELDYDARQLWFAWSEAEVPVPPTDLTPREALFTPESTYHVFTAAVDGSGLTQLTDGPYNDFDPCLLPGGRIAFISERRGGYLRCGLRPNPTFTLHSMRADGSDIICLSHHETHEWHPSVDNSGMIVYSRWDYVDRDSDMAHHLWKTYPDGRDPRTNHGNYPPIREMRPWMELSIRAVPVSPRYVAVAATHHGQNYGSIVLIDPNLSDDGAMSQVRRITPDVAFPESEIQPGVPCDAHGGRNNRQAEVYGTPWPLSEQFYLCVYDRGQKNYGLYLVDVFGNRELLYRDQDIACLDPIPLRARPRPPVIPAMTQQAEENRTPGAEQTGRIAIANVYESDFDWPANTKIVALRIIQLFPKTTPGSTDPNIGAGAQSLARGVVGTVAVEEDGSVYCEAPVGVPIYFQAIDANGRAVQSMMSDTYLHPGETLSCAGCHEPKQKAQGAAPDRSPLAMRRAPSPIRPELDGAYPVLYPRLVQPVLDRHCAACHEKEDKAPGLKAAVSEKWGWSESYQTLSRFAWAMHGGNGALATNGTPRSIAGRVGANASPLISMLDKGHHNVSLPGEDLHRLVLWLDCNSVFYGAYDNTERQGQGHVVMPSLQ